MPTALVKMPNSSVRQAGEVDVGASACVSMSMPRCGLDGEHGFFPRLRRGVEGGVEMENWLLFLLRVVALGCRCTVEGVLSMQVLQGCLRFFEVT